jgi:hypothetical protein
VYTLVLVDGYDAVLTRQRARDTAAHALRIVAMAARHGKVYLAVGLDFDVAGNLLALQRLRHVDVIGVGKRAIILAQLATQAPLFIYIYSFHIYLLRIIPYGTYANFALLPYTANNGTYADFALDASETRKNDFFKPECTLTYSIV